MQDLSDISLARILVSLKLSPLTLDLYRRTCKIVNQQAISMELDTVENVILNLSSSHCTNKFDRAFVERQRECYSVRTILNLQIACTKNCKDCWLRKNAPPRKPHQFSQATLEELDRTDKLEFKVLGKDNTDENVIANKGGHMSDVYIRRGLDRVCWEDSIKYVIDKKTAILNETPSTDYFIKRFKDALKRVHSVGRLELSGWFIGENLLEFLVNHPKLRNIHEIFFTNCVFDVKKNEFAAFLQSRPINKMTLQCKFKQFSIDESCLMNVNIVYICGFKEIIVPHIHNDITDNLIRKWIEQPPVKITFNQMETNFTLNGIIELLKASIATKSSSVYQLGYIPMTTNDLLILLQLHREMIGLNWVLGRYRGWSHYTIGIHNNKSFRLSFTPREISSK